MYVIIGLGVTGFSCARFLKQQHIPFSVIDTRTTPPHLSAFQNEFSDVPIHLGRLDEKVLQQAEQIILSPGIALHEPAILAEVKRGIPVIGDIELFAQAVNKPIIAITGTNAKSTVTTLVAKMAEKAGLHVAVGGNLGVPVLDLLLTKKEAELFVLELSSFQLETTYSLKAKAATILNITPDHMDRYPDFAAYQAAKHRIFEQCQTAVCNRDDDLTYCRTKTKNQFYFTLHTPKENEFGLLQKEQTYLAFGQQALIAAEELPIMGKHYQANALAALALGFSFGLPWEPMLSVLREFKGLPHRCQLVRQYHGVRWYNDSKGTNVGATLAAIEGLGKEISGKLILIAGGVGKHADFSPLVPVMEKYVRHAVLIGEAAQELAALMSGRVRTSFAGSMDEAVSLAAKAAEQEDCVLLSPACASFDMFNNFEHRGEVFIKAVERL